MLTASLARWYPDALHAPVHIPPSWLTRLIFVGLALLLFYPVHIPYQNPDQDMPVFASLMEFVRGGWVPFSAHYPSGLTNILRATYEVGLGLWRLVGSDVDRLDMLSAWYHHAWLFRIPPRVVAMSAGVVSLLAVWRLTALLTDACSGLLAAVILGTSLMFVREHHHGMWDAPASAAVIVTLYCCTRYLLRPSQRTIFLAGACAGVALSFKQNALIVGVATLSAIVAVAGSWREKGHACALALGAAVLSVVVLSPGMIFQADRFLLDFRSTSALLVGVRNPSWPTYDLRHALRNGVGLGFMSVALLGVVTAVRRREWALLPLVSFVAVYAAAVSQSWLILNRYALPLAPPLAALAAYGLHRSMRLGYRLVAAGALVAVGLPACLSYLRLIAVEDTRVAAARWLREHVRADASVLMPGGPYWVEFVGPDLPKPLPKPLFLLDRVPPPLQEEATRRVGASFPNRWGFAELSPREAPAARAGIAPVRWVNSIVVTSEHADPPFAQWSSTREVVELLERRAKLLQDFPNEHRPAARTHEPVDLNYAPFSGGTTLLRPGPRMRIWYVPPADEGAVPSPFLVGSVPPQGG